GAAVDADEDRDEGGEYEQCDHFCHGARPSVMRSRGPLCLLPTAAVGVTVWGCPTVRFTQRNCPMNDMTRRLLIGLGALVGVALIVAVAISAASPQATDT